MGDISSPQSYADWFSSVGLASPPVYGGTNGRAEGSAAGQSLDAQVALLKAATKARMPDFCPPDALPRVGANVGLLQGPYESNASFIIRCKNWEDQWSRAGTACGVLEQIAYFTQSVDAVFIQQNGLAYQFSAMPTPGVDPTPLLVITPCSQLAVALTSSVTPPTLTQTGRSIPAGNTWFEWDSNTDLCNRFAIYFPVWPMSQLAFATFSNTDSAVATWPIPFPDTNYGAFNGPATDNVEINIDGGVSSKQTTSIVIRASAPWTGTIPVVAWDSATTPINPLNIWSATSANALQSIINKFRSTSLCVGVYAAMSGKIFGWPIQAQSANTMGTNSIAQILAPF